MASSRTVRVGAVLSACIGLGMNVATARAAIQAFGLDHTTLGQADVGQSPGTTGLTISNIGSSGQDGVSVNLINAAGWSGDFEALELAAPGEAIESRLIGSPLGLPSQMLASTRIEATDAGADLRVDFGPLGAPGLLVTLYDQNDTELTTFPLGNDVPLAMIPDADCPDGLPLICVTKIKWICDSQFINGQWQTVHEQTQIITCACVGIVNPFGEDYNNVYRIGVTPDVQPIDVGSVNAVEILATSVPSFELVSEAVQLTDRGPFISAIGATTLEPSTPTLTLDDIGCFGEDGVAMELGEVGAWDAKWDALDIDAYPLGSGMDITLYGRVDGQDGSPVGTMQSIKESDGQVSLYTDFSALGSVTQRVDLFLDGILQATFEARPDQDPLHIIGHYNTDAHYSVIGSGEPCSTPGYPCLFAGYTFGGIDGGALALVGGAIYVVDEIRVYPETPLISSVDVLSHIIFYATDIFRVANLDITTTELPAETVLCAGDANADQTVDPLDSGYVQARFGCTVGAGDSSCDAADQNGDGLVDPLDSGYVQARFGTCVN